MVNQKKGSIRARHSPTPGHLERTLNRTVQEVARQADRHQRQVDSGARAVHKAKMMVSKYGLVVRVGNALYPVPHDVANNVMHLLSLPSWERRFLSRREAVFGTIKYIARCGEGLSRKKKNKPIILTMKSWKHMKHQAEFFSQGLDALTDVA